MIRLYHGSNTVIERVDLSKGRPNKDFGRGFVPSVLRRVNHRGRADRGNEV